MDQDLKKEVLDVRKVIEKSTSKVSLRDLEKKGFRQVKVLRAGDINQLIFKAVQNVLAKQPRGGMSDAERDQILAEAKADFESQLAEKKALMGQAAQINQAKQNLELKLAEVNKQLAAEKQALIVEKQNFERDRQALMERSLEGQKSAAANYGAQVDDLKTRLAQAEERTRDSIPKDEYEQVRRRLSTQVDDLQEDVDRYRKKASQAQDELEAAQAKVRRLETELTELKESGATTSGGGAVHDAELQRMRMEMEQRHTRMQEMMSGIANSLVNARGGGGGGGADFSEQFKKLQNDITSAVRKATGKGKDEMHDLTPEQAAALFANMDETKLESNIKDVDVKTVSAAGVKDKLAKLRNMRGK